MRTRPIIYLCFALIFSASVSAADVPGGLPGIEGEYRGTVKRTEMTLWAATGAGPGDERTLALMSFPTAQRQAQTARLLRLTKGLLAAGQDRCDLMNALYPARRPGTGDRAGLALVYGGWESQTELKIRRFPESYYMVNDEYVFLRGQEDTWSGKSGANRPQVR